MGRAGTLVPLAVAVALVAGACGGQVPGSPAPQVVSALSPAVTARDALLDLAGAGAVRYAGSLTTAAGRTLAVDAVVTSSGEVDGTVGVNGEHAKFIEFSHAAYMEAPSGFFGVLAGDPGSRVPAGDARWSTLPDSVLGVDLGALLAPASLGAALAGRVDGQSRPATVGTTAAHRIGLGAGAVFVGSAAPNGVLRVEVPAALGSVRDVALDVTDATGHEAATYRDLAATAGQLGAAVDAGVSVTQGPQSWGPCSPTSCAVVVTVANPNAAPVRVVVDGTWSGDGTTAGTCEAVLGPVAAHGSVTGTCTDSAPEWAAFYQHGHVTPGQHPFRVDWTARALAPPPDTAMLAAEAGAAASPAAADPHATGAVTVYAVRSRGVPWRYGVAPTSRWRDSAAAATAECGAATGVACAAGQVTATSARPAADALVTALVAGRCPPGQWVACP